LLHSIFHLLVLLVHNKEDPASLPTAKPKILTKMVWDKWIAAPPLQCNKFSLGPEQNLG